MDKSERVDSQRPTSQRANTDRVNLNRADTDRTTADQDNSQRVWGTRKADAAGIAHTVVEQMKEQMQTQLQEQMSAQLQEQLSEQTQKQLQEQLQEQLQTKIQDLHSNPPDYRFQVDSLLELLYIAFTEYNITETPEFKAKLEPLEQKLRSLAWAAAQGQLQAAETASGRPQDQLHTTPDQLQATPDQPQDRSPDQLKTTPDQRLIDEVADEYMNYVYGMCAAYERQSYIEGIKVGARLMMELMG